MATKWKVRGVYFEACNCEVVCPCIFASRPTNPKNCTVLNGWHIEKGRFGTTDLSGLNVAMAIHSPGHMLQVKWKAALYVDDQAGKSQGNALTKIFSGQAGGHPALLASFVGRLLGVRSVPIEFKARGKKRSMIIPDIVDVEVEAIAGQNNRKVVVTGHPLCVAPGEPGVVARCNHARYRDHGRRWTFTEKSGLFSPFTYAGP